VLALDYGSARCGCAISDPTGTLVRPLDVVERPDSPDGLSALADLTREHDAQLLLVGLPRLPSGEEGQQAAATRAFVGRLGGRVDTPIELYDERFTTQMAQASALAGAGAAEDSLAAAHLLEEFLATRGSDSGGDATSA
jgi:putative Holliday junction resolvase